MENELSPEEIKLATIAFMGQHLTGDLKMLNSNMVSQNPTCRGNNLNPMQIINTIPSNIKSNPVHTAVNAGANLAAASHASTHQAKIKESYVYVNDHANTSDLKEILSILKRIEDKLDKLS